MPDLVVPMQPTSGPLPEGDDWAVEFAWEGLRAIAHVRSDGLRLRTANGREVTASFPELVEPLTRLAPRGGMVLDGTVVALGEGGLPRRRLLQRRTAPARPSAALLRRTPVGFVVGDLLWLDGHDAVALPYRRRRDLLEGLGLARPPVVVSPAFPIAEAEAVMRTAEEYGAEALHARHLDAPYRPGRRSPSWLRVPLRRSGLVVVGGWNPADPRRPDTLGALLLGVPGPDGLRYVGRVGLAGEEQREVAAQLTQRRRDGSPFALAPPAAVAAGAQWVAPQLVGSVEFADWTPDGRLRLPVWRGLQSTAGAADGAAGARWVRPPGVVDAPPQATAIPPQARGGPPAAGSAEPTDAPADTDATGAARGATAPRVPAQPDDRPATGGPAAVPRRAAGPGPTPGAVEARRLEQHFVYNALNTIASLMRTDPVRARELLLGFADLTRAADRPEGVPGTLGDELAAVRAYLQLEQARFGRRLQVEILVDEGLHPLPMTPRRVLDAVRAVVQQRIEPRPGGGTVTVTAERAGDGCLVRVAERDDAGRGGDPTLVAPA
jgi:bifunctional non-homologous end joining protein LigD